MHRSVAAEHPSDTGSAAVSGAQLPEPEVFTVFPTARTFTGNSSARRHGARRPCRKPTQRKTPLDATRMRRSPAHIYSLLFRQIKLVPHTARHAPTAHSQRHTTEPRTQGRFFFLTHRTAVCDYERGFSLGWFHIRLGTKGLASGQWRF